MSTRAWSLFFLGAGFFILLSNWSVVTRLLVGGASAIRPQQITVWDNSGEPQRERRIAAEFMEAYPDISLTMHFRESGSIGEVIFASFLSGNPPDLLSVSLNQVREYIVGGFLRPMDDLLEAELARNPDFLRNRLGGELSVFRWRTNPNDPYLQEMERFPEEAARLLYMHDRVVGLTDLNFPRMLTFNRRIFREAAAVFPEAGLLDENGEPVPPATWSELVRVARVITAYGSTLEEADRVYGIVLQGQRPRDIMRGLEPLAATAGSRGFNFRGRDWIEGFDGEAGFYEYDHPAILAALELLLILKEEGSILPGTPGRHFEEPRTLLGEGRAAMLLEDWHAAHRAAVTVPIHRLDIGSAPVPVPDEAFARRIGRELEQGRSPAEMGGGIVALTSQTRHPDAVWRWMMFGNTLERQRESVANHIVLPRTREAAERLFFSDDPSEVTWRKENLIPFQPMAWRVFEESGIWPQPPVHSPVRVENHMSVLHAAFHDYDGTGESSRQAILERARHGLQRYSQAVNRDLADKIIRGEHDPASFTFPDWNPMEPTSFFERQMRYSPEGVEERLALLREQLPASARDITFGYSKAPGWPHLVAILLMILLTVLGFLVWQAWQDFRASRRPLQQLRKDAANHWYAYLFVFPAILSLFAFVLYPSLYQFYLAFHSGTGLGVLHPAGWSNFSEILLRDPRFWSEVVPNTVKYMLVVAAGEVIIGLLLAMLLVLPLRANQAYRLLFFVPLVTSLAAISIIFFGLLAGHDSTLNSILIGMGVFTEETTIDWLNDPAYALYTVMAVAIWSGLPFNTIICMAGLQSIAPELYEAAKIDGARAHQRFWHVTIPQMLPILIIVIFNSLVGAARHFGTVYIMTEGERGTEIVSTYIFKWGFVRTEQQVPDIGYASALGLIYAVMLGGFVIFNVWYVAKRWRQRLQ